MSTQELRSIETAPKDGTKFLSYVGELPVMTAFTSAGYRILILSRDGDYCVHGNFAPISPTHWMPLPEPGDQQ